MTLKIISSEDILFEGEVKVVHLPGTEGAFTVLPRHASLISTLTPGVIGYEQAGGSTDSVEVNGGIVDIDRDVVSVCIY
ncbi:MAG: ATP synthase F1 subunit epsilon [Paramuribaculum sp.]|nr:ATP synthase F1 subunit epsilon [Paramuribaculum sp.]